MYKIRRVDVNQPAVVKAFRDEGCTVLILSEVGKGCPDLCISKWIGSPIRHKSSPWSALVEIKDGEKPQSGRKLTPDEQKFHESWQGEIYIIGSADEARALIRGLE